ncbi:cytochrome P450 [Mycena maculata]|uniref:Cytochrome P450 n=1 Tax=Mycena maculata TaxID=230809 RepID=A0AAD7J1P3_9AGAR|nr:cytochrome P450 [Mycena maculata]
MLSKLLLSAVAALGSYAIFHLVKYLHQQLTSPLRGLPGPPNPSLFLGHFKELTDDSDITQKWKAQYGLNFQMKNLFSTRELYTADTKALTHIAVHSDIYQKAQFVRYLLSRTVGNGLLVVEGDDHRRQRKILNPAFGVPQIRELTSVFVEKSIQLRNIWASEIASADDGAARIDVLSWTSKTTLDIIGQAGFNYHFNALSVAGKPSELNKVFSQIFHGPQSKLQTALRLLQGLVPILRPLASDIPLHAPHPIGRRRLLQKAQDSMARIGEELLAESRAALNADKSEGEPARRRDLLSLLLKANASDDAPLSDKDLIAQLPAFFVAGHETTSTATAWALYALARNPAVQQKLRTELLTLDTDEPSLDNLNALPYLEMVLRETLRAHSPVTHTGRIATADDVLPLARPYVDAQGRAHDTLRISKGQLIHIPIFDVNTDTDIWGPDAATFRPERWDAVPESARAVPGVWAHLFTFLAGPRNCIGFRFALAEMKALLFVLVRAFEFEIDVPEGGVGHTSTPVQRPIVLGEREKGAQMPLIVRPYRE